MVLLHQPSPNPHYLYVYAGTVARFVVQLSGYILKIFLLDEVEVEKVHMQQSKLKSKLFFLLIFSYSISHHEMRTLFFIFLEMISGSTLYPSSNFYGWLK